MIGPANLEGENLTTRSIVRLTEDQVQEFKTRGFVKLNGFYDLPRDIFPIQEAIHRIIGLVIATRKLPIKQKAFTPADFDSGYQEVIAIDRRLGGVIYDAVKQIPAFIRLLGSEKHEMLMLRLRGSELSGVGHGSYGIRIDNPGEDRYNTLWHQDYPSHLRSPDGVVFWASLVPVKPEMGPVQLCVGSHVEGLIKLRLRDGATPDAGKNYQDLAKNFVVDDEANLIRRYPMEAPTSNPGDLIVIDYMTLHRSGQNVCDRSRWSMQFRYFNFEHPFGANLGWCGSLAAGIDFRTVHPEIMVE